MSGGRRAWGARIAATLLLATVLVGPGRHDAPANAEPTPPPPTTVSVSARDTMAVVSWAQPNAGDFLVEVTAYPSFAIVERTTVARDLVVLDSLTPGTTYYLRVSALSADGDPGTPSSPVTFTTRSTAFPFPAPVLTVDSDDSTSLTPRWIADGDELSYQVEFFPEQSPSQLKSRTVQASEVTFKKLKAGTRYSTRVRIVDAAGEPRSDWSSTLSREPAKYLPLRVASFNIQKWTQNNWSKRRTALASIIRDQDPDVVGLQEATPTRVPNGRRQYTDLVHLLGADWALTEDRTQASGEVRTIYNRTRLELLGQGQHALTGSTRFGVQRYATWALFQQRSTGKRFIFVNTHFAVHRSGVRAHHTSSSAQLVEMVERVNTEHLPVVIVGDFNSGLYRNSSNGVYRTITGSGYLDPLVRTGELGAAEKLTRADLKTYNNYARKAPRDSWARMIDHIFVSKMRVAEWETVARLDRAGRWIGTIPSDHNMIRATVYLP